MVKNIIVSYFVGKFVDLSIKWKKYDEATP